MNEDYKPNQPFVSMDTKQVEEVSHSYQQKHNKFKKDANLIQP
jgi:hypothetical protein